MPATGCGVRRFLKHVLRFCALPVLVLLAGEAVLESTGELWPVDRVLDYQRTHPESLYLRAVDQTFYTYKYEGIIKTHPSVLVVGSSRTMKFRAEMFGDRHDGFFNAGGILNNLNDLTDLVNTLPEQMTPAVMILGIDLWWLNDGVPPTRTLGGAIDAGTGVSFDQHVVALRWLVRHPESFSREALSAWPPRNPTAIGIAARERGGGFRRDGSYATPLPVPQSPAEWRFVDRESPPIIERVKNAVENFPPASGLSADRLAILDAALDRLGQRGVLVIGYLPPFSTEVVERLRSDPRHARLWAQFRCRLPAVFQRYNFPVVDASELSSLQMDDRAMSDGMHAEETFHVHVVEAMLRDLRVGVRLPGARRAVERALASPSTNYWNPDLRS